MSKFINKAFPLMTTEERAAHEANRANATPPVALIVATFAVLITIAIISWVA